MINETYEKHITQLHLKDLVTRVARSGNLNRNKAIAVNSVARSESLSLSRDANNQNYVLLGTAIVKLVSYYGKEFEVRAILFLGSQVNLRTKIAARKLGV